MTEQPPTKAAPVDVFDVCILERLEKRPWAFRGGVLIFMRGRSRMAIDPRIRTTLGRSTSGFHRPGRHCLLPPSAKRNVRCWASRMTGGLHPLLRTAFEADPLAYVADRVDGLISDSVNGLIFFFFGVATSRDSKGLIYYQVCNCLVGALPYAHYYTLYVMRSSPLRGCY